MDLFDLLACPTCRVAVARDADALGCPQCQRRYPIIDGVPVMLPDGSVPQTVHQHELHIRPQYDPWVHRVVLQSLPSGAVVLDLGAGNMALNLPHVIRMDVTLTPYVDVVGDAHALPFLPGVFDFVFSLAVIEHLRQPFVAAEEMRRVLHPGGYVYGECNFVFAYHGYPHHYFNASQQGLEQVFRAFARLRSGVAPYQMPSFALRMFVLTFLQDFPERPDTAAFREALRNIIDQPLGVYDGYLTEEQALRTAAGVYFFGYKPCEVSEVIPPAVQARWAESPALQQQFPQLHDIGRAPNIMLWARSQGAAEQPELAACFDEGRRFRKAGAPNQAELALFGAWPVVDPAYGNIPDAAGSALHAEQIQQLRQETARLEAIIAEKNVHIGKLEQLIERIQSGRVMRLLRRIAG